MIMNMNIWLWMNNIQCKALPPLPIESFQRYQLSVLSTLFDFLPDFCHFWGTNSLLRPVKRSTKKCVNSWQNSRKNGQNGSQFFVFYAKRGTSLKKLHICRWWQWWLISAMFDSCSLVILFLPQAVKQRQRQRQRHEA